MTIIFKKKSNKIKLVKHSQPLGKHSDVDNTILFKTLLKKYLQSYLVWLQYQNPRFSETLSNTELSNYFLQLQHPRWFLHSLEQLPFETMLEIDHYISVYKQRTLLFNYTVKVIPKESAHFNFPLYKGIPLTAKQKDTLTLGGYGDEIFRLSKPEATITINMLCKKNLLTL